MTIAQQEPLRLVSEPVGESTRPDPRVAELKELHVSGSWRRRNRAHVSPTVRTEVLDDIVGSFRIGSYNPQELPHGFDYVMAADKDKEHIQRCLHHVGRVVAYVVLRSPTVLLK